MRPIWFARRAGQAPGRLPLAGLRPDPSAGAWLLVCACALLLLPSLGLYPLFNDDEGAFSEATREILQSGDWLSTTLNGAPRYDKPILIYWLQALSVSCLGLNEFALRLPSALAALAWIAAIVRFAMPRLGPAGGLLAGWIAGHLTRGRGFGCVVDIVLGLIGAVVGGWIFTRLGIVALGFWGSLAAATVGAVLLVAIARLFAGSR